MIDYQKAEQAKKLLEESGVDYTLAYIDENDKAAGNHKRNVQQAEALQRMYLSQC